jgi:hypothetical protein
VSSPALPTLVVGALVALAAGAEAQWQPIVTPPVQRDAVGIYERAQVLDPLAEVGEWSPSLGEQNARCSLSLGEGPEAGSSALLVTYSFEGKPGLEYVEVARAVPLPEGTTALGLRSYGGEQALPARVRLVDANGEWHQFDFGTVRRDQWTLGVADLTTVGGHWGGDDNGVMDRPVRIQSILFDRPAAQFQGEGTLRIAELATYRRIATADPHGFRIEIPSDRTRLVYEPGQEVQLRVGLDPAAGLQLPVTITATQVDPFGHEVRVERWEATSAEPHTLSLPQGEPGSYDLRLRVVGRDEPGAPWADLRFAVLPQPGPVPEDSPFGFSTHFGQGWDPAWMDLLTRIGVRWYRDEIGWGGVEQQKGTLAAPPGALAWAERGQELGLELLLILDYANENYDGGDYPVSAEARAGFARYSATMAEALRGTSRWFEVWNEWCGGCGMGTRKGKPEEYGPLYLAAAEAVRAANPDAQIVGIGGEYGGKEDVARTLGLMMRDGAGAAMDGFSIHPYHYPGLPGAAFGEHLALARDEAARAAGKPLPLWITEIGWPTHMGGNGSSFLHQARCLVRMYTLALGTPGVERVFWYDLKDDGTALTYNEANFGVVHNQDYQLAPKPAYAALAQLVGAVGGRTRGVCERGADGLWTATYEGTDDRVSVVFADAEGERVRTPLPAGARVTDLFGRPIAATDTLEVDWNPVFVWTAK